MKYGASCKNTRRSTNTRRDSKGIEQEATNISIGYFKILRTYAAATAKLLHFLSFLGDVNSLDDPDSPESAICIRAIALRRSTSM